MLIKEDIEKKKKKKTQQNRPPMKFEQTFQDFPKKRKANSHLLEFKPYLEKISKFKRKIIFSQSSEKSDEMLPMKTLTHHTF